MDATPATPCDESRLRRRIGPWLLALLFLVGATGTPVSLTVRRSPAVGYPALVGPAGAERHLPPHPTSTDDDDHAACLACVLLLFPTLTGRERTPVDTAPEPHRARYRQIHEHRGTATMAEARAPPEPQRPALRSA